MLVHESSGIIWLQFDLFADFPELIHGIFLRQGGSSKKGPHHSLNIANDVGDNPVDVHNNLQIIQNILKIDRLYPLGQCHGTEIQDVSERSSNEVPQGDAQITSIPEAGLLIQHADCQAGIFYDPVKHVLANVHAGWRGSVGNIYGKVVQWMSEKYGSNPKDIRVGISPSLGPDHAQFINYKTELPQPFWKFQTKPLYFDFWKISAWQLEQAGVLPNHIQISGICTFANPELCFSYRRDRITGRHGTLAALR